MAAAKAGIKAAEDFWKSIGMPVTLQEICGRKLTEEDMKDLSMRATKNDTVKLSRLKPLGAAQVVEIYRMASGDGDMGSL